MRELPTGTVTFLFTDIEGSTRLLGELRDAYAKALGAHRRALREVFAAHDGAEVDTQGDAFFVAFGRANDAITAAADAQRALVEGPIRVRMGIHTGEPLVTEEGYAGIDVHRAARIAASGHGGQVLLSQTARDLVEASLPNDLALHDLGAHRLKDLGRPERNATPSSVPHASSVKPTASRKRSSSCFSPTRNGNGLSSRLRFALAWALGASKRFARRAIRFRSTRPWTKLAAP